MDTASPEYRQYGGGSKEQAFYKVYYHLLFQSIRRLALEEEGSNVLVLLDYKRNQYPFRLAVLKKALNAGLKRDLKLANLVANVESRDSSGAHAELLIQVVDVLIGAIGHVRNGYLQKPGASAVKAQMVRFLESQAGTSFAFDTAARAPFNLWTFDVGVAMERKRQHEKKEPLPHLTPSGVALAGRRAIRHGIRCEQRFVDKMTERTADVNNRKN